MGAFDNIIGYGPIKEELRQLCDMIHHREVYDRLGAKMPKGLLLHGEPGVGKSLMALSFIRESGRKAFTIRRNKHDGDFIDEIKRVFVEAAGDTPAVVLLDDMDKFVVEEDSREEYVAVQACMDEVKDADVYVVATVNDIYKLPDSLLRAGRFDRKIRVGLPKGDDAVEIIRHYLSSKTVDSSLCVEDIAKMMNGKSCADLETILNEAAIHAGFERCEHISMAHIVRSVLRNEYGASASVFGLDAQRLERVAFHEAGHVVVSECLQPGSIGLASLRTRGERNGRGGFVVRCLDPLDYAHSVQMLLAGMAATELRFGVVCGGNSEDIHRLVDELKEAVADNAACGLGLVDIFHTYESISPDLRARQEVAIHTEIGRYMMQVKQLLAQHMDTLIAVAIALLEKETLLHSEIQKLMQAAARPVGG